MVVFLNILYQLCDELVICPGCALVMAGMAPSYVHLPYAGPTLEDKNRKILGSLLPKTGASLSRSSAQLIFCHVTGLQTQF